MKKGLVKLVSLFAISIYLVSCSNDDPSNPYANDNDRAVAYDIISINDTAFSFASVDLGLSVDWASCNLGANIEVKEYKWKKPNGEIGLYADTISVISKNSGSYFAWGELNEKPVYTIDNYRYFSNDNFVDLGTNISGSQYDAATQALGDDFRMPAKEECQELLDKCDWIWVDSGIVVVGNAKSYPIIKDLNFRIVTDSTEIHDIVRDEHNDTIIDIIYAEKLVVDTIWTNKRPAIFLPSGGNKFNASINNDDKYGGYWSSTSFESCDAWSMGFSKDYHTIKADGYRRFVGRMIRPVRSK